MPEPRNTIQFQHLGIGASLNFNRLRVPVNQREYKWGDNHVTDLLHDFANAISDNKGTYFLGTIVLTQGADGIPEIADGQQRLATTTILLAAIRDWFRSNGQERKAQSIEQKYLGEIDEETDEVVAKLTLNVDDQEFFQRRILSDVGSSDRKAKKTMLSHGRIDRAAELAAEHIQKIVQVYKESDRAAKLMEWVKFIRDGVQVIILTVPDHLNAFMMFETLNDRGLKASQADLLKNHLLSKSGNRGREVQQKWSRMLGVLESATDEELTMTYLRHLLTTLYGPTKEREVFGRIQGDYSTPAKIVQFATLLAESATDYVALLNPAHSKWNEYGTSTKRHVKTMIDLGVEQIRPLMFAVTRHFSVSETKKAFRLFVSWSVRFLVVGGRGGLLDRNYAVAAHAVGKGEVKTAKELAAKLNSVIPPNATFEAAFSEARVSKNNLARYYLRALEQEYAHDPEPELVPNDDEEKVNLEHVLPENPASNWPKITPDEAEAYFRRVGNLALLPASKNTLAANAPFKDKKKIMQQSGFYLNKSIANAVDWGIKEISDRQKELAKLAIKAWPLEVR